MNKTYHITTFGCQMNYSDSERIATVLESLKFKLASESEADILVFNLCSVRQHAIDRIWGLINKIKKGKWKKKNEKSKNAKEQKIILTGCILPADKKKFEEREIMILDIKKLNEWPKKIKKITNYRLPIIDYNLSKDYFSIPPKYFSKFSAYVPIMTGCNNFCAYCAVPYTRGREYSRSVEEILNEVNKLIVQGYKEIILLGQNVNSYAGLMSFSRKRESSKQNLSPKNVSWISASAEMTKHSKINFPTLIKLIDTISGNYWLSFLTSHPKDMSADLINCFNDCKHLVPYLHLPLQAGSNKILKAMNRNYSLKHYNDLIKNIRQNYTGALPLNLSTDIIVGFPQETMKDFESTKKALETINFDMAYLAEYSPRPGTAAFKLKDNVLGSEKEKRKNILNEILKKTALENNKKMVGSITEVLIDKIDAKGVFGKTKNFKRIKVIGKKRTINKKIIGSFVPVKIIKANVWNLEGEIA